MLLCKFEFKKKFFFSDQGHILHRVVQVPVNILTVDPRAVPHIRVTAVHQLIRLTVSTRNHQKVLKSTLDRVQ
jgi:hypothetical protein